MRERLGWKFKFKFPPHVTGHIAGLVIYLIYLTNIYLPHARAA